jgi:hypothetical protein
MANGGLSPNRRTDGELPEHPAGGAFDFCESGARRVERGSPLHRIEARRHLKDSPNHPARITHAIDRPNGK